MGSKPHARPAFKHSGDQMEEWKPIPGHFGYEASDMGRLRSIDRTIVFEAYTTRCGVERAASVRKFKGRILRPARCASGHWSTPLGRGSGKFVHVLVMLAFVGPPPEGHEVAHNDGDPSNNSLSNLRYATRSGNMLDKVHHGQCLLSVAHIRLLREVWPTLTRHGYKSWFARELGVSPGYAANIAANINFKGI